MAVGPLLQFGLLNAGLWWAFSLIAMLLAVLLIVVSSPSRLGPDASRSCVLRNPAKRMPARVNAYILLAFLAIGGVVICVAWSQVAFMGPAIANIGPRVLFLGAFWAALTVFARAAFSAIDLHARFRRGASLGLFLLPVIVTVIGLTIGRLETAIVGIFLLAAVVCAAFLPPASELTERQLVMLPLVVGAGIIGIYPVAIALARPSLSGLRRSGAPLPMIFTVAGLLAIFASLACARLIAYRSGAGAAGQGAAADRPLVLEELPPPYARPCTAVELPRRRTASREAEDRPGVRSGPRHH